jgi:FkbM family methyltransferase
MHRTAGGKHTMTTPGIVILKRTKRCMLRLLPLAVFDWLKACRVWVTIHAFRPKVVEHRYGDSDLRVYLADPVAQAWYDRDWSEADMPDIAALRTARLREGALVFDIGAHQGVVALMLAREVGPTGRVIAVEPNHHNYGVAIRNRDLNSMPWIEFVQAAISQRPGEVVFNREFNGQLDDGTGAEGQVRVRSLTIDGLAECFGMPDVVFLDIEGAECMALGGASALLARGADFLIEVHVNCGLEKLGGSVGRLLDYFPPDRFCILARRESEMTFHPFLRCDPLTAERFFLFASPL